MPRRRECDTDARSSRHFERDLPVMLEILGEIDRGHPALLALDPVAVDEDGSWQRAHAKLALGGGSRHGRGRSSQRTVGIGWSSTRARTNCTGGEPCASTAS
jgi:hypothetical protein